MKYFAIGLAVLAVLLVGVGLALPTEYRVEESLVISAPPAEVHALLADLERWPDWAPWQEDDPTIVTTYGETTKGVGAHQSWTSESGDGELTLTRSDPATGIAYDMAFIMGDTRAPSRSAMDLESVEGGTRVTWWMEGDTADFSPPIVRGYLGALMPSTVGEMFQRGLANLKREAEAS